MSSVSTKPPECTLLKETWEDQDFIQYYRKWFNSVYILSKFKVLQNLSWYISYITFLTSNIVRIKNPLTYNLVITHLIFCLSKAVLRLLQGVDHGHFIKLNIFPVVMGNENRQAEEELGHCDVFKEIYSERCLVTYTKFFRVKGNP